jgi:hypothetical protein
VRPVSVQDHDGSAAVLRKAAAMFSGKRISPMPASRPLKNV